MSRFSDETLLVPVDFSDRSLAAVDVALDIVGDPAKIRVVHILHEPQSGHPDAIWVAVDHAKRREHVLSELGKLLSDQAYTGISFHVEFGEPGFRIAELAQELDVGLIVIPSHGRTGIKHLLIGSVAERVVRHAHCPVLVLRE